MHLSLLILSYSLSSGPPPTVAVIDTSGGEHAVTASTVTQLLQSRGAFRAADGDLHAALNGTTRQQIETSQGLRRLQKALAAEDCGDVLRLADELEPQLVTDWVLAQSRQLDELYAAVLVCATRYENAALAAAIKRRAAALKDHTAGPNEPDAVSAARYFEIRVDAFEAGDVWLDGRRLGPVPQTPLVATGRHILTLAAGDRARSFAVEITDHSNVILSLPPPDAWIKVRRRALAIRSTFRTGARIRRVLEEANLPFAILVDGPRRLSAWDASGRRLAQADSAIAVVDQLGEIAARRAPRTSERELLREGTRNVDAGHPWWVYTVAAGALAAGVTLFFVSDFDRDTQIVEVAVP